MRNKSHATATMVRLLENARYEVLPTASIEATILEHVDPDTTLTVTASPSKGLEATLDLTERLTRQGYTAVPHLAARMIRDRAELSEICERLTGAGIDRIFVPGGDADEPGAYPDALALLEDLAALGRPFPHVGSRATRVAPDDQRRPDDPGDVGQAPLRDPRREQPDLRPRGARHLGVVGCASAGSRCHYCSGSPGRRPDQAAVDGHEDRRGESTRFLAKHKGTFARLAAPGGFTGERFLEKVAPALSAPQTLVEGLHVFTFNQVPATVEWRRTLLERLTAKV